MVEGSSSSQRRALLALALYTFALFGGTVVMRRPWYGEISEGGHYWLTSVSIRFVDRWYEEGAWKLGFTMIDDPPSVEFQSLKDRSPYMSYGSGARLPLYALARLQGHQPTPRMVMGLTLVNHFVLALLVAGIGFLIAWAARLRAWQCFTLGACAASVELLVPGTLYYLQNVYFSDQAVLVPFVLAVLLELLMDAGVLKVGPGRWLQAAVIAFGIFTDWFMVFVAAGVYTKRLLLRDMPSRPAAWLKETLLSAIPVLVPVTLFLCQIAWLGWFRDLYNRWLWRTSGATPAGQNLWTGFCEGHLVRLYGVAGAVAVGVAFVGALIAFAWVACRERETISEGTRLAGAALFLLAVPAALQLVVFRQHSVIHEFSGLKLSPLLALGPLVLLPIWWIGTRTAGLRSEGKAWGQWAPWAGPVLVTAAYLAVVTPSYRKMYPPSGVPGADLARTLRGVVGFREVVLSPTTEIPISPPQLLTLSNKRVYKVQGAQEALHFLTHVRAADYTGDLLYPTSSLCAPPPRLSSRAQAVVNTSQFLLLRFRKEALIESLRELDQSSLCKGGTPPI